MEKLYSKNTIFNTCTDEQVCKLILIILHSANKILKQYQKKNKFIDNRRTLQIMRKCQCYLVVLYNCTLNLNKRNAPKCKPQLTGQKEGAED